MELNLQTYRLTDFMSRVEAKLIDDLVKKEKIHPTRIVAKHKYSRTEDRKLKLISFKDLMSKKNDENQSSLDGDKLHQTQKKFGALMGVTSNFRINLEEKENSATLARTRFLKASKMTVMINSMKQGQVLCTCSSLASQCAQHDS
jgi:hypothetical protein